MNSAAAVLAVDDNATIRKAISMRLAAKGYQVDTANDGVEALRKIARQNFDLVILDLQMPGIGGDEVLRRVRETFTAVELPVIMLTANSDKLSINRSLELGANDYIVKPGDLPILLARIRTQLALRESVARLKDQCDLIGEVVGDVKGADSPGGTRSAGDVREFISAISNAERVPFDVLHDNTPMTCFALNAEGAVIHANRFGANCLGYTCEELVDKHVLELYAPEDRMLGQEQINTVFDKPGRVRTWEIRHLKQSGESIWMRNTARAVEHAGRLMMLVTCEDINERYELTERLAFQASHDELTGFPNRKTLETRLARVLDSAHAENTEHALALIDVDQFKFVNDACGHGAGDELLRQVAQLLRTVVRKRDTIARIGADEFAVLIEDCPVTAAYSTCEALRRAIEEFAFEVTGEPLNISVSIGIVPITAACEDASTVLSMADTACYAAKDSGRNRTHVYQPDNVVLAEQHGALRWLGRINRAVSENRFTLALQPICPVAKDRFEAHYEILLRMRDEHGGVVLPGEFLPAAERYSITDKLDRWVVGALFDWFEQHPERQSALGLCCINLSGQSIGNDEVLKFILEQLRRRVTEPEKICFEITETAAIADLAQANRFIQNIKDQGCRFALDDFGTGFSSFTYLKQLPVDYLKIDGSFVRDIASDSTDLAMVRSINEVGHVLGKQTIAEFVENTQTLELLRSVGVDFAQGYHLGRPAPIDSYFNDSEIAASA